MNSNLVATLTQERTRHLYRFICRKHIAGELTSTEFEEIIGNGAQVLGQAGKLTELEESKPRLFRHAAHLWERELKTLRPDLFNEFQADSNSRGKDI